MTERYDEPDTSDITEHVIEKPPQYPDKIYIDKEEAEFNCIFDATTKKENEDDIGYVRIAEDNLFEEIKGTLLELPGKQTHFKFKDESKFTIIISDMDRLCLDDMGTYPNRRYLINIQNLNINLRYYSEDLRDQDYEDLTNILTGE